MYQRSADIFLGLPYDITLYSLLTMLIAYQLGLDYGRLIISLGDSHIYLNHIEQCKLQLSRELYNLPQLQINHEHSINILDYPEQIDVKLVNYFYHDAIKAPISV